MIFKLPRTGAFPGSPKPRTLKPGSRVTFKPEWRDTDDSRFVWAVVELKGDRLDISPLNTGLRFPPVQTVRLDMLEGF